MTLYEMTRDYAALYALAADPDADPDSFDAALAALEGDIKDKAASVAAVLANMDAMLVAIESAAKRYEQRYERMVVARDRLKGYLLERLQAAGIQKIETADFTISVRGCSPRVEIDAEQLPAGFLIESTRRVPDRPAIKKALESGQIVPGARLSGGQYVRIR